jgi:putative ABC transport system permease protein
VHAPEFPLEYKFLDEQFEQQYAREEHIVKILQNFTILALFISCLGIFGLATFIAETRTKEIGIRKVLGASSPGTVLLLSKDVVKWIVLANIIAWPVAWIAMEKWLQNFAYRIEIGWVVFLMAFAATLFIAISTFSMQAIRAAMANPVDSLRNE